MASICVKEFALRRDAQHYAHLIDVDRGAGSYIDPRLGRITVAEWFERWWPTVTTLRPSTRGIRSHVLPSTTTGTSSPNTYPDMMQKTGRFKVPSGVPRALKLYAVYAVYAVVSRLRWS